VLKHFSVTDSCFLENVPKTHDSPSLIYCGRLVLADACLFTDLIQCCNVTNDVLVPFSLSRFFLQVLQVWCYNNNHPSFYTFYIRSLAIARFD